MKKPYIFLNLLITQECNLRCKHCYNENFVNLTDDSTFFLLLNEIKEMTKSFHLEHINILGGEPFVDENIVSKLSLIRENYDGKINIGTNGTILDDKIIDCLKDNRINLVQISIEASDPRIHDDIRGRGTFEKTLKNINKLISHKIPVSLRTTISKFNINNVEKIIKLGRSMEVDLVSFSRYIPTNYSDMLSVLDAEDIININNTIKEYKNEINIHFENPCNLIYNNDPFVSQFLEKNIITGCSAGINSITIDSDGNVYYCTAIKEKIGNIRENSIVNLWQDKDIFEKLRTRNLHGKCGNCKFKSVCGGCRAIALYVNGSLYTEDPTCIITSPL